MIGKAKPYNISYGRDSTNLDPSPEIYGDHKFFEVCYEWTKYIYCL